MALAIAVGLAGPGTDYLSGRQEEQLIGRIVAAEQTVVASDAALSSLYSYLSPVLDRSETGPDLRRSVLGELGAGAQRWLPELRQRRRDVGALRLAPWDDRLRQVRGAYLHRLDAWVALVQGTAMEPEVFLAGRQGIRAARQDAEKALLRWNVGQVLQS